MQYRAASSASAHAPRKQQSTSKNSAPTKTNFSNVSGRPVTAPTKDISTATGSRSVVAKTNSSHAAGSHATGSPVTTARNGNRIDSSANASKRNSGIASASSSRKPSLLCAVGPGDPMVSETTRRLWELFRRYDINGDGKLSRQELTHIFKQIDPDYFSNAVMDDIFDDMSMCQSEGYVNMHQFAAWIMNRDFGWDDAKEAVQLEGQHIFNSSDLVRFSSGKVTDTFDIETNTSKSASLHMAKHKDSGKDYAIRCIRLNTAKLDVLQQEISVMLQIDHPNIVRLYEVFRDAARVYLVLEQCNGGAIFERVCDEHQFTERQAASLMQQILWGVRHIHGHGLCVGNLSCENIAFKDPCFSIDQGTVKVIDFGQARKCDAEQELQVKARIGRDDWYVAPETFRGVRSQPTDMWACGVVMYIMLCGYPPFCGKSRKVKELDNLVSESKLVFPEEDWKNISTDAKDLIESMICRIPAIRITAEIACSHRWLTQEASNFIATPFHHHQLKLKDFCKYNAFKKGALHVIARHLSEEQINDLRKTFLAIDTNHDSTITFYELKIGLDKLGMAEQAQTLRTLMESMDVDGNLKISYTEFLAAATNKNYAMKEDVCWEAFRAFDIDDSGAVTRSELQRVIQDRNVIDMVGPGKLSEVSQILLDWDSNKDGKIIFREFMAMMRSSGSN